MFVVELRHICGMILDDDGRSIPYDQELDIILRVVKNLQRDYPLF